MSVSASKRFKASVFGFECSDPGFVSPVNAGCRLGFICLTVLAHFSTGEDFHGNLTVCSMVTPALEEVGFRGMAQKMCKEPFH